MVRWNLRQLRSQRVDGRDAPDRGKDHLGYEQTNPAGTRVQTRRVQHPLVDSNRTGSEERWAAHEADEAGVRVARMTHLFVARQDPKGLARPNTRKRVEIRQ